LIAVHPDGFTKNAKKGRAEEDQLFCFFFFRSSLLRDLRDSELFDRGEQLRSRFPTINPLT